MALIFYTLAVFVAVSQLHCKTIPFCQSPQGFSASFDAKQKLSVKAKDLPVQIVVSAAPAERARIALTKRPDSPVACYNPFLLEEDSNGVQLKEKLNKTSSLLPCFFNVQLLFPASKLDKKKVLSLEAEKLSVQMLNLTRPFSHVLSLRSDTLEAELMNTHAVNIDAQEATVNASTLKTLSLKGGYYKVQLQDIQQLDTDVDTIRGIVQINSPNAKHHYDVEAAIAALEVMVPPHIALFMQKKNKGFLTGITSLTSDVKATPPQEAKLHILAQFGFGRLAVKSLKKSPKKTNAFFNQPFM